MVAVASAIIVMAVAVVVKLTTVIFKSQCRVVFILVLLSFLGYAVSFLSGLECMAVLLCFGFYAG